MPRAADVVIVERVKSAFARRLHIKQRIDGRPRTVSILHNHRPLRVHRRIMFAVGQRAHLTHVRHLAVHAVCNILQFHRFRPVLAPCASRTNCQRHHHSYLFSHVSLNIYRFSGGKNTSFY